MGKKQKQKKLFCIPCSLTRMLDYPIWSNIFFFLFVFKGIFNLFFIYFNFKSKSGLPCFKAIGIFCHWIGKNWSPLKRQTIGWEKAFKDDLKEAFLCSLIPQDHQDVRSWDMIKQNSFVATESLNWKMTELPVNEQNLVTFKKNVYTVNLYILR